MEIYHFYSCVLVLTGKHLVGVGIYHVGIQDVLAGRIIQTDAETLEGIERSC